MISISIVVTLLLAGTWTLTGPAVAEAEPSAAADPSQCDLRGLLPHIGCDDWAVIWDGPYAEDEADEKPLDLAVSPDGQRATFVGEAPGPWEPRLKVGGFMVNPQYDAIGVIRTYDIATGDLVWNDTLPRPGSGMVSANMQASVYGPEAETLFVGGNVWWPVGEKYAQKDAYVAAFDATTGDVRWETILPDTGGHDEVRGLAVSDDGTRLYAAVNEDVDGKGPFAGAAALDTSNGSIFWDNVSENPVAGNGFALNVVFAPDSDTVFVTARSWDGEPRTRVLAYQGSDGTELWDRVLLGDSTAVSLSADEQILFLAGARVRGLSSSTGETLWQETSFAGRDVVADPGEDRVYVVGNPPGLLTGMDIEDGPTIAAFRGTTGELLWSSTYDRPRGVGFGGKGVALSPDGSCVYAAGWSYGLNSNDGVLRVVDAENGEDKWTARFDGPTHDSDEFWYAGTVPGTSSVVVAGESYGVSVGGSDLDPLEDPTGTSGGAKVLLAKYTTPC